MSNTKLCPYCGEEIKAVAIKCRFCGERLDKGPDEAPGAAASSSFSSAAAPGVSGASHAGGEILPGARLGSYVLDEVVGAGGMGTVYRGHHQRLGQNVAIKVLDATLARDPDLLGRFEQEARLQANLHHTNIVSVTDFIADGPLCAFIMEYVNGLPLDVVIERAGGPIPFVRCRQIFVPVLDAMAFAHEAGIVHRDIKPSNIMLATIGDKEVVKVTDFGIAKALGDKGRTVTGTVMGTLPYMSPEQCQGAKDVDHRADIYSLGVTLFEMATGQVPFPFESGYQVMTAHVDKPPPRPSEVFPDVHAGLDAVLLRALEKSKSERFQSAEELKTALEELQDPTRVLVEPAKELAEPAKDRAEPTKHLPRTVGQVPETLIAPDDTEEGERATALAQTELNPKPEQEDKPAPPPTVVAQDTKKPKQREDQTAPPPTVVAEDTKKPKRQEDGQKDQTAPPPRTVAATENPNEPKEQEPPATEEAKQGRASDPTLEPKAKRGSLWLLGIGALAVFGLVAGLYFLGNGGAEEETNNAELDDATPSTEPDPVPASPTNPSGQLVVARVGDVEITVQDVADSLNKMTPRLRKEYAAPEKRRRFLDNMIRFELIAMEAEARGYSDEPDVQKARKILLHERIVEAHKGTPGSLDELTTKLRKSATINIYEENLVINTNNTPETPPRPNRVLAEVNGHSIQGADFEYLLAKQHPSPSATTPETRIELLHRMVEWELLAHEADRRGLGEDAEMANQQKRVMSSLLIRHQIDDKISPQDVTDEEMRAHYEENIKTFKRPERVRAYHIVISSKQHARALLDRLQSEAVDLAEFRRLAREMSEDPATKRRGGDLRYFSKTADTPDGPEIHPAIVAAAFKLHKRHPTSGDHPIYPKLVKTPQGYHIIRYINHREPVDTSFDEARETIREQVWRKKLQKAREVFVQSLREKHPVKVYPEKLSHVPVDGSDGGGED